MNKKEFIRIVSPNTMTCRTRIECLYDSLERIRTNNIQGDFAECGVWKGGNVFGIAEYLSHYRMTDRKVWLYDTFKGMAKPRKTDCDHDQDRKLLDAWEKSKVTDDENKWCYCSLENVKALMDSSTFPKKNISYVIGDVCETLVNDRNLPTKLALLRLDTDWYESTKIELMNLYPKLSEKGTLIVDDYFYWRGSKIAVDEYFNNNIPNFKIIQSASAILSIK